MDIAPIRENHMEKTMTKHMVTELGGLLGCSGLDSYQCHLEVDLRYSFAHVLDH